jgi:nicotinamidase-related amidase
LVSFGKEIDLGSTGLLVMDFWNNTVAQYPGASANIVSLIQFARKNGIPVVHLLHEGWQNPAIQADSGEHIVDIKNYNNHIESYLDQNNITTVLVAGYGTGECVTISRVNSIHRISQRSPGKDEFVLLKDCTEGDNQYAWGMNGVETRFQSSSLSNLFQSVGVEDTVYQTLGQVDGEFFTRTKQDFGIDPILFDTCALVLVNTWETHPNDGFAQRIKQNLIDNILPMLHFARAKGMKIVYVTNGRQLDTLIQVKSNEFVLEPESTPLNDKVRLWNYLKSVGVKTIFVAGNFTNTTEHFPLLDAWGLSTHNDLPAAWPLESSFNTCFLEDCITVFETPETLSKSLLKQTK